MKGQLFINGLDAFVAYGAVMGNDFVESLVMPAPMKDYIENNSRIEHGKRVIADNPKLNSREITLNFLLKGLNNLDFSQKFANFASMMQNGTVTVRVPAIGSQIYKLVYKKSASYAQDINRTMCKISIKFEEPNPMDR